MTLVSLSPTKSWANGSECKWTNPMEKIIAYSKNSSKKIMTVVSNVISTEAFEIVRPGVFFREDLLIDLLPYFFEVDGIREVKEYLVKSPFILNLLLEAHEEINLIFGLKTKMRIEVSESPDSDTLNKLFLYIIVDMDVDRATELLSRLDDKWWLLNAHRANHKMNLDLEFL